MKIGRSSLGEGREEPAGWASQACFVATSRIEDLVEGLYAGAASAELEVASSKAKPSLVC